MQERELSTCTRALNLIPFEWMQERERKSSALGKCGVCCWWKTISFPCVPLPHSQTAHWVHLQSAFEDFAIADFTLSVLESSGGNDCIELFHYWSECASETFCLSSSIGLLTLLRRRHWWENLAWIVTFVFDNWGNTLLFIDQFEMHKSTYIHVELTEGFSYQIIYYLYKCMSRYTG